MQKNNPARGLAACRAGGKYAERYCIVARPVNAPAYAGLPPSSTLRRAKGVRAGSPGRGRGRVEGARPSVEPSK